MVGRPDRPSPDINSKIVQINFNPYWTVPVSIVRKDLIPLMQDKPDYLTQNHIRVYDPNHKEVPPSQVTGLQTMSMLLRVPGGSRQIKFARPASASIFEPLRRLFMHDTPLKNLFGGDFRYNLSGCLPVQTCRDLVVMAARRTRRGGAPDHIAQAIKSGDKVNANLTKPVAALGLCHRLVRFRRLVQFREDIYNRDGLGGPAIPPTVKL